MQWNIREASQHTKTRIYRLESAGRGPSFLAKTYRANKQTKRFSVAYSVKVSNKHIDNKKCSFSDNNLCHGALSSAL